MKLKVKEAIEINDALHIGAKVEDIDSTVKYAIARNIQRLKKVVSDFHEANKARIESFTKKDDKGEYIIVNDKYDFGDKQEEATKKWEEIINEEVEFEVYQIKRSQYTDKLPAVAQSALLDIVITE